MDETDGWRIWASLGSASISLKDALSCYRLAYYYFLAGILGKLTKQGVRENGEQAEAYSFPEGE